MANTFVATQKGHEKRVYILEPWEKHTLVAAALVEDADSEMMSVFRDVLRISCVNGKASYRLVSFDEASRVYLAELVSSTYRPPPDVVRRGMN